MLDKVETGLTYLDPPRSMSEAMGLSENATDPEGARRLIDWLLAIGQSDADEAFILEGLCDRLIDLGVPIDRVAIPLETLHSQHRAVARFWRRSTGVKVVQFNPVVPNLALGRLGSDGYLTSPIYRAHMTGLIVRIDLRQASDDMFKIIRELKDSGAVDYLCMPMSFGNGDENALTMATTEIEGFSPSHVDTLRAILPAASLAFELRHAHRTLDEVLRIYVGEEPHQRILAGDIQRGSVTTIRSAILVADMRGYTEMSMRRPAEEMAGILNMAFDALVPAIERNGGEVLKYLGDGLLAIFRDTEDRGDTGVSCYAALRAAQEGLAGVDLANDNGGFPESVRFGIALHHGMAAYGNVGSGVRLDFTVIGRDVNIASRVAQLNRELGEPLIVTRSFADHIWSELLPLGEFALPNIAHSVTVFKPRPTV